MEAPQSLPQSTQPTASALVESQLAASCLQKFDCLSQYLRLAAREGMRGDAALRRLQSPDIRFLELRRLDHLLRRHAPYFGQEIQVRRAGWRGRVERLIKTLMRKVLRSYAWPQIEFNEATALALGQCLEHITELDRQVTALKTQLRQMGRHESGPAGKAIDDVAPVSTSGHEESCAIDYYIKFEERFRGSREAIRDRQQLYVDWFIGRSPVLDVGCGRGEFLELLYEKGIVGYGVDLNEEMVAESRAQGFHVVRQGAHEYLEELAPASLGGIFAAQVIEHFPPAKIGRLLELARGALTGQGIVILETPNPICEAVLRTFYIDPTHVRPVHPELVRFLGEEAGLKFSRFIFSSPLPGIDAPFLSAESTDQSDATGYRDYAIVLERR
jgi:SAM-dependent methyltransferase